MTSSSAEQGSCAPRAAARIGGAPKAAVVAVLLLAASSLIGGFLLLRSASVERGSAPALAGGPLGAAVSRDPRLLPPRWRGARVVASDDDLDGATPLIVTSPASVLLLVDCPSADRSFQATSPGAPVRYGACGRVQAVEIPSARGTVLVTTRGVLPFRAALLAGAAP